MRERREDIPLLTRHFAKKYSQRHRKPVTRINSAALNALSGYDWPGNVRELEHVIERAVIVSQGSTITVNELDGLGRGEEPSPEPRTLEEAERAHIVETLSRTNWILAGKQGAAEKLGMKRSTLQHRMKKLAIRRPASTDLMSARMWARNPTPCRILGTSPSSSTSDTFLIYSPFS